MVITEESYNENSESESTTQNLLVPKLEVILSNLGEEGDDNMVELETINNLEVDGEGIYDPDGNIIISDPSQVMILQMEEGGESVNLYN